MSTSAHAAAKPAYLLWTSGWDSTFRLLQLLLIQRYPVQPCYVLDPSRRSVRNELAAIDNIKRTVLREHPECAPLLRPTQFLLMSDIPADPAISTVLAELRARHGIGEQYDWLARYAKQFEAPLELSVERYRDRHDKWRTLLGDDVIRDEAASGTFYRIKDQPSNPQLKVFSLFHFPVFDLTKLRMLEIAKKHGFAHILELTWFCHKPMPDDTPCGTCAPCCYTREDGLGFRIGRRGNLRDKRNTLLRKLGLRK